MKTIGYAIVAAVLGLGVGPAEALAQANRTFVSGHGSDGNPCSLGAPCRGFQKAHDQTNPGGEITILDPAGYGPVTITKAISIVNDGVGEAGITTVSATNAIMIAAGPDDIVNLRGLTLVGGGIGADGVAFTGGRSLNIQNCVIRGFSKNGLEASLSGDTRSGVRKRITMLDTAVSDNGFHGISINPSGIGTITAVFKRVHALDNAQDGFLVTGENSTGTLNATIADSVASGNVNTGIAVVSAPGKAGTTVVVVGSQAVNNANIGLSAAGANALMLVGQSTVSGNEAGWSAGGPGFGTMESYGNNNVGGNNSSELAMPSISPK